MDRRTFVKRAGIGSLLIGLGALAGVGCSRETTEPSAGTTPEASRDSMVAICPNCKAENDVTQWGVETTCWKCGHKWTPREPA